jgi:hypothetical protein
LGVINQRQTELRSLVFKLTAVTSTPKTANRDIINNEKGEDATDATDAADATAFCTVAASTRSKRKLYIFALTEYKFYT